ncbi:DUF956 family protein [Candidatus Schmidhempelia bombi]|uniref:DUF956 family protein n=1 Tax=Candidatus Schmidhempelia bombi str. Bimp TaxID=1387197 RepID=A0AB94IDF9_9GAMM|nr:DUF956 family protein [Candidatus Schmidhempelia bombi]TEA27501.1 DUF956 family protein [Candidatus Schmidhempelia bombi str. Bimp]
MVLSLNTKADFIVNSTLFLGLPEYGKIMIGDKAFEFYHQYNSGKFVQIPWGEIELVQAMVLFKGKWIPRYAIHTKRYGTFTFASQQPKLVLKAMHTYIDRHKIVKSPSLFHWLKQRIRRQKLKQ